MTFMHHTITKHEIRNIALGLGLLGVVAFVLFRHKGTTIVDTSSSPDGKPITLPANAFEVPSDFSGLDGNGLPFTSYAPKGSPFDPAVDSYLDPAMTPDPAQTYNPVSTVCGC